MTEVAVIGAGLSGLVTACALAREGVKVRLIAKGMGSLPLGNGTIDLWGCRPSADDLGVSHGDGLGGS
ncbi:MAG: FAD-binding protein, partial [Bifidobacteriaceae bacterium]|nr:FAD-binding protein [Bifidobacteriaceae bacterium]